MSEQHHHPGTGLHKHIDIYCERTAFELFNEPFNALTNLSFIIAALFAFALAYKRGALDAQTITLIVLTFAIGIGSTLFHTYATLWAMMSDVIPILLYKIAFIVFYTRFRMNLDSIKVAAIVAAFFITMQVFMQLPREWLNGSLEYGPALIFVTGLGIYHMKNMDVERFGLLAASGVFVVSLTFRSIDYALCDIFPIGTHFMWHVLNGAVLYLTTRAYIMSAKP